MAMYILAVTLLIDLLHHHHPNVSQACFADDATAAGQLTPLLQWWKQLLSLGPLYGYHPNAAKTYFIVKPQLYDSAKQIFQDTYIHTTRHGQRHLGAAIGTLLFTEEYVSKKVKVWSDKVLYLLLFIVLIAHLFVV